MKPRALVFSAFLAALCPSAHAHELNPTAHYIANEGVLVEQGELSILFDPLPLSGFGVYAEPSQAQIAAMIAGQGIFEGVDAVFISHAHRDHFSPSAVIAYLSAQPELQLVAPQQALDMMREDPAWSDAFLPRVTALDMAPDDAPRTVKVGDIHATAVRIPHSGWPAPRRAAVQNMVYRVTLSDGATVMHMGDADVNRQHYTPHAAHWAERQTDTAFPPYWFLLSNAGQSILTNDINVAQSIGTHVPLDVPQELLDSGADYFSIPGESRDLQNPNARKEQPHE